MNVVGKSKVIKSGLLITFLFFNHIVIAEEWSAYIYPPSSEARYIGRFETKEDCQSKAECYISKANKGFLLGILFSKKIEPESYQCSLSEQSETEKESKEAKKWTGKFIFGLTDESCAL